MRLRRIPPDPGDEIGDDEITLADEDWPVAEHYRVTPPTEAADAEEGATVVAPPPVHEPAQPGPLRSRQTGFLVALAIVGALLLLAGIGAWLLTREDAEPVQAAPPTTTATQPTTPADSTAMTGTTEQPAEVPSLVGLGLSAARTELQDAGLRASVRRVDSNAPRDEVLRQSPRPGAEPPGDGVVALTVSSGTEPQPRTVRVPDVVGMMAVEATRALRDAGLRTRIRTVRSSEPAGTVLSQEPRSGADVEPETSVELRVAKPAPPERIAVPDVEGSSLSDAQRMLRAAGLRWTVNRVPSPESPGTVVGQSPAGGTRLAKGEAVALRVSSGPTEVSVPSVVGLDEQTARDETRGAGFDVNVVFEPTTDPSEDGLVVSQDPRGGTNAPEGSLVTLTVARLS